MARTICALDSRTARQAAEHEFDDTFDADNVRRVHGEGPQRLVLDLKDETRIAQEEHDRAISSIGDAIPADNAITLTGAEDIRAVAEATNSMMSKAELIARAEDAPEARLNQFWDAWNESARLSVREASAFQNICVDIDRRYVDSSAGLKSWASRYFNLSDQAVQNNPIIRGFHTMQAKVRGLTSKYYGDLRGLTDQYGAPIAERLNISNDEAMRLLGVAATAKFAPIRNQQLVERWQSRLEELSNKKEKFTEDDMREFNTLQSNLKTYELYKNDANPLKTYEDAGGALPLPKHSGYTDAEAERVLNGIRGLGISDEEIDGASRAFSRLFRNILQDRVKADLVSPATLKAFPELSDYYVPMIGKGDEALARRADKSLVYDPGYFHAMEGRSDAPDSAYDSYLKYANRASHEIGKSDFGMLLWACYRRAKANNADLPKHMIRDNGLRVYRFESVDAMRRSDSPTEAQIAEAIEGRGGIVTSIPQLDANGRPVGFEKVLIQFDPSFNRGRMDGTDITGKELNDVLSGKILDDNKTDNLFHKATGIYGQLFTRFVPAFAPVNATRDIFERAFHMANRDIYTEDGSMLSGAKLIPAFIKNAPRTNKMLYDYMHGKATGLAQKYGDEYKSMGLMFDYSAQYRNMDSTRSIEQIMSSDSRGMSFTERTLRSPEFAGMRQVIEGLGKGKNAVMRVLDGWNDHFNNSASFDQYVTLREAGVSARDAGAAVLEMMDLYQSGTRTNFLRAIFPFVRPTLQSAANMARTLGFTYDHRGFPKSSYKGWAAMLGAYAVASGILLPLVKEGLGNDENGNSRLDSMGLSQLAGFIPIGMDDGSYMKLPTGYGPMQVALTLAYGIDRVQRGLMTGTDLGGEVLHSFGRNMLPGNWPEFTMSEKPFAYVAQLLAPAIAQPIIEAVTNTSHFGQQVSYSGSAGQAKAYQGGMGTPAVYHRLAKAIHQSIGWDMAPEQVRSVVAGFAAGPLKIFKSLMENGNDEGRRITGKESWSGLHPMLAAFGGTMMFGDNFNTTRSLFYKAYDIHKNMWMRAGLKLTSNDSHDYRRNKPEERAAYQRQVLTEAGFSDQFIEDWLILDAAQKEIQKLNSSSNDQLKSTWIAEPGSIELREAFEQLADQYQDIYARAVNNMRYYK